MSPLPQHYNNSAAAVRRILRRSAGGYSSRGAVVYPMVLLAVIMFDSVTGWVRS